MRKLRPLLTDPRKLPVQARSTQLVADILEAAVRVLERDGAHRFTTIRVAHAAGVSVGSLYQYFPNKQAILFRLQTDEWSRTSAMMDGILGDTARSPQQRLHDTVRAFFRSECDEAPLRRALAAAAPSYHDAPESRTVRRRSARVVRAFVAAAAPHASPSQRRLAGELLFMTMSSLGKQVSERDPSRREVDAWAATVADMLGAYLARLAPRPTSPSMRGRSALFRRAPREPIDREAGPE